MIAASPNRFASLELVQLTLSLLSRSASEIPVEIGHDFIRIIEQANQILQDPKLAADSKRDWQPEAISLALLMQRKADIAQALSDVTAIENINETLAQQVLDRIESGIAA